MPSEAASVALSAPAAISVQAIGAGVATGAAAAAASTTAASEIMVRTGVR